MKKKTILRLSRKWMPVVTSLIMAAYYLVKLVAEVVNYHDLSVRSQIRPR